MSNIEIVLMDLDYIINSFARYKADGYGVINWNCDDVEYNREFRAI